MNSKERPDHMGSPSGDPDSDASKNRKPRIKKTGWQLPKFDAFEESDRAGKRPFSRDKKFGDRKPGFGSQRPFGRDGDRPSRPRRDDEGGERSGFREKRFGDRPSFGDRREDQGGERKFGGFKKEGFKGGLRRDDSEGGDRPFRPKRDFGDKPAFGDRKPFGAKKPFGRDGDRPFKPRWNDEEGGERSGFREKRFGDRPAFGDRRREDQGGDRPFRPKRDFGDKPAFGDRKPFGAKKPFGRDGDRPFKPRWKEEEGGERSGFREKRYGDRPAFGDRRRDDHVGDRKYGGFKKDGFKGGFRRDDSEGGERSFRPKRDFGDKPAFGDRKPFGDSGFGAKRRDEAYNRHDRGPSFGFAPKPGTRKPFDKKSAKDNFKGFGAKNRFEEDEDTQVPSHEITGIVRLNKYISHSGICARREADDLIVAGKVTVNGEVVTELGTRVNVTDTVTVNGHTISFEPFVYLLMHKPKNTITTTSDEKDRQTVMDLVAEVIPERVYPVGRLDRNTTGALLLTNDGDLANRLMHPSYTIEKVYQAEINRVLSDDELIQLTKGVELEDGSARASYVVRGALDPYSIEMVVHEGRNHLVRRMIEALGAEVVRLKRSRFAGLDLDDLRPGRWRFLKPIEINTLRTKVKLPELKFNTKNERRS